MSGQPLVSILLPNYNNGPILDLCLQRLHEHTSYPNLEIVAADDGSTDQSLDVLRRWRDSGRFPAFKLVEREHTGIVSTLNEALEHVSGEIIVRIDGDATVESDGWLETMLAFHTSDPRIGVTVAKIVLDSGLLHAAGVVAVHPEGLHDRGAWFSERVGSRTVGGTPFNPPEDDAPDYTREPAEVDSALGTWTMFSTELARTIGGWDMGYEPVWFEDFDFALSARRHDRKVFYLPDVRVIHRVSKRDPRIVDRSLRLRLYQANRRFGHLVPQRIKNVVARRMNVGHVDPARQAILQRHCDHWRTKWGWDPLNPDMEAVHERWSGTEICWAHDAERRRAGEEILARWAARDPASALAGRN
jgi:GT2 family glycosyltransferase